jgi:4-amino-4-deoxy-L-arabinose transferase-like glycosyltransferase
MPLPAPSFSVAVIRRRTWSAVACLLIIYAVQALWFSRVKGAAFDESEQLFAGYNIWLRSDFRMEGANGDFVKRWATLPFLFTRPRMVSTTDPAWRAGDPYWAGSKFLFENGNDADWLLLQGRLMIMLLGVMTGLLVFRCARHLFGRAGGVVALAFFAFSPNMLAFGGLVSTEMSLCLGLLGSTWCVWRLLHRITWGRIAASLAFFALLVLSKPTAALILPVTALLIAAKLKYRRPLWILLTRGEPRPVTARGAQAKWFAGLIALHAVVGYTAIWAHYDFRFESSPNPADNTITRVVNAQRDPIAPEILVALRFAQDEHLLPESFVRGVRYLLGHDESRHAFLAGEWKYGGWADFFPRAALAKTRPETFVLGLLGLGWWICRSWRGRPQVDATGRLPSLYMAVPYFVFLAVYLLAAVVQDLNIGHRHILPLYPVAYVLCGVLALWWREANRWLRAGAVTLGAFAIVETLVIAPHYLAYFSPLVGGPKQGYTQLVDSSLDWGTNLPGLRRWLDQNNAGNRAPVFLAYFGTDSPDYRGIACRRLPGFFEPPPAPPFALEPGLYAISATLLQTVYTRTFGPWNKVYEHDYQETRQHLAAFEATAPGSAERAELIRQNSAERWTHEYEAFANLRFGRLCAYLRHHGPPDAAIGYAILIWRLEADELRAALEGPPAELAEAPVRPP